MAVLSVRGVDEALMEKMRDGARLRRVPLRKYVLELLQAGVQNDPARWYMRDGAAAYEPVGSHAMNVVLPGSLDPFAPKRDAATIERRGGFDLGGPVTSERSSGFGPADIPIRDVRDKRDLPTMEEIDEAHPDLPGFWDITEDAK